MELSECTGFIIRALSVAVSGKSATVIDKPQVFRLLSVTDTGKNTTVKISLQVLSVQVSQKVELNYLSYKGRKTVYRCS